MTKCVVYWKHLPDMTDDYVDGYIGISKNFEDRMKQHHRDAFVRNSIYTVHEQMRYNGDAVITDIIFKGSIEECFDLEESLRPHWHMGWNMAIGGGRPGSGWKPSTNWLCNRLWHPEYGEEIITIDNKLLDLAIKYHRNTTTTGTAGHLGHVLSGRRYHTLNWTLANAQLAEKVKTRLYTKWNHVYIKRDETVISVYKSGNKAFHNSLNRTPQDGITKHLFDGTTKTSYGWELATKEEWLATEERLEFK